MGEAVVRFYVKFCNVHTVCIQCTYTYSMCTTWVQCVMYIHIQYVCNNFLLQLDMEHMQKVHIIMSVPLVWFLFYSTYLHQYQQPVFFVKKKLKTLLVKRSLMYRLCMYRGQLF